MSSINVNHEELRGFSQSLISEGVAGFKDIEKKIEDKLAFIHGNGWDDNKFTEFYEEFEKSKLGFKEICDLLQQYSGYLAQKASKVEEYQSFKINSL